MDFGHFRTKVAIAVLRLRVSSRCLRAASPSANASRRSLQQARIAQPRHAATPTCLGTTAGSPRQHRRSLTPPRPLKLTALGHRSLADANQPGATAHSRFRRRANCQTVRSTTVVRNTPRGHTRGQFIFITATFVHDWFVLNAGRHRVAISATLRPFGLPRRFPTSAATSRFNLTTPPIHNVE